MANPLHRAPSARVSVLLAAALVVTGTGVTIARPHHPPSLAAWELPEVSDGLVRAVVTLRPDGSAVRGTSLTSGSRLPAALLAAAPAGVDAASAPGAAVAAADPRPQLDLSRLERAHEEIGADGHLARDVVDGAEATLWVVGTQARVVSRGGPWAVSAPAPAPAPSSATAPVLLTGPGAESAVDRLRATRGVRDAQAVGDGSYLVTSSLSVADLASLPFVVSAVPSQTVPVAGGAVTATGGATGDLTDAWHLENTGRALGQPATAGADVSALDGWQAGTGTGAVVAVLDTGFDTSHTALTDALWTNPAEPCGAADTDGDGKAGDCHGWNFYTNSADVDNGGGDGAAHGTWTSGTVAARPTATSRTEGLAPGAQVMPLVVGRGRTVDMYAALLALRYAADHGADVVNASFGGTISGPLLDLWRQGVQYAGSRGVLVVASSGNDGKDIDASPVYPASLTEDNVISVGASTAVDGVASFSNTGATGVDLFAPGLYITTTSDDGRYQTVSGTSFSAPLVAAAAALHRAADPTASAADLRTRLMRTAAPLPAFSGRSVTGARLDVGYLATTGLRYDFAGLGTQPPGAPVQATVRVRSASAQAAVAVDAARISLLARYQGETWAVTGTPLQVAGQTLTTDDDGSVTVPLPGADLAAGVGLDPAVSLPEGQYAVVVELVSGGVPVAAPRGAPLTVAALAATPEPSGPTSAPAPGTAPGTGPSTAPSAPTAAPTTAPSPAPTGGPPATAAPPAPGGSGPAPSTAPSSGAGAVPQLGAPPTTAAPAPAAPSLPSSGPTPAPRGSGAFPSSPSAPSPSASQTPAPVPTTAPVVPTPQTPSPGASGGAPSAPPPVTYPGTDPFGVTSVSPSVVSTAGGQLVTISGSAIPSGVVVRVGATVTAEVITVVQGTGGHAVVRVPARAAGVYDVLLSGGGQQASLPGALTYTEPGAAPAPALPAPPGATPVPTGAPAPPSSPSPSASVPAPSSTPSTATPSPVAISAPNGLRLRRSPRWSSASTSVWLVRGCEASCAGVDV